METMWLLGNMEKVNKVDSHRRSPPSGTDSALRIGLFDREKAHGSDSGVGPVRNGTRTTHKFAPYSCNINRLYLRQMNGSSMAGLSQEILGAAPWLKEKSGLNIGGVGTSHSHASLILRAGGLGDLLTLATPPPPPPPPSAAYNFSGDPSNVPYPAPPATLMMNNSHNFPVFDNMPSAVQYLENDEYVIYDERSNLLLVTGPGPTAARMNNIWRCSSFRCRAVDTPMWRRGPLGPKTLCNACGIKYRKEEEQRQAREEEEAAANYIMNCWSSAHPYKPNMQFFKFI